MAKESLHVEFNYFVVFLDKIEALQNLSKSHSIIFILFLWIWYPLN
jgi:hypothetical protein